MQEGDAVGSSPAPTGRLRARDVAGAVLIWTAWAYSTIAAISYIHRYARNMPYYDDLALVGVMTGHEPLSFRWLTIQHNEHRPVIPKLILAVLLRTVPDFRAGLYLNVGVLSATAAWTILVVRRVRGRTRLVDAALPVAILNLGQCECLLIGFALNLVMTAWISWGLIATFSRASESPAWRPCLQVGLMLVLLPLCGGSGLIMMPPLVIWLAGYVACGWWSGRDFGPSTRRLGIGLLLASAAGVAWYLSGYQRPAYIPAAPSARAACLTMLQVLSLAISPIHWGWARPNLGFQWSYWRLGGLAVVLLSAFTVIRLAIAARRSAEERPRALGLIAMMTSLLGVAASVGLARSGLGPDAGLSSRYVTISMPLIGVVYFAWLLYGSTRARRAIHIGLLTLVCMGIPVQERYARAVGQGRRARYVQIECRLKSGVPTSRLLDLACRTLSPNRAELYECLKMLTAAQVGVFRYLVDDGLAVKPDSPGTVRR
jgi:hypothetical protein